jgi:outer membrane protein OmpA-like peptidoglycan-associated protein
LTYIEELITKVQYFYYSELYMRKYFLTIFLIIFCNNIQAQQSEVFRVDRIKKLKKTVLKGFRGYDIQIKNVRYRGARRAIGEFWYADSIFQMMHGIILSTGKATDAANDNNNTAHSVTNTNSGDRDFKKTGINKVRDLAVLEFDFYPGSDYFSFNYVFASEAYPEFTESKDNDVVGIILTFPDGTKTDLAKVPGKKERVSVNSINHKQHPEYYINNCITEARPAKPECDTFEILTTTHRLKLIKKTNTDKANIRKAAMPVQYDGMTKVLQAGHRVEKNKKHHIKIVIADRGNRLYDSAVFIEAGSFHSHINSEFRVGILSGDFHYYHKTDTLSKISLEAEAADTMLNNYCFSQYPEIQFDYDSPEIPSKGKSTLKKIIRHLKECPHLMLRINGYAAALDNEDYNNKLSKERAENVRKYLIKGGLISDKISMLWHGNSNAKNKKELKGKRKVKLELISLD